ncbi:predicted MFS family arabinose efflux permease [Jatrophihabitans sp. GAS493]|uniref:MFS transporter n=1 Tax=Jatrophihabitans sp. GAS493 TaxID=1907575 RepID=UPI000BC0ADE8|nr:MFS transporter [Jatrophihabitans sp. GAS493]SOD70424.1 predicted MFS family arabinose efflux permease [Jatrophihabitans sp. GAS493]
MTSTLNSSLSSRDTEPDLSTQYGGPDGNDGSDAVASGAEKDGMFRSLRVRNYRLYASGQLISLTGTWMARVAQDWLVLELTNSGTALGIVTALQFGPALLLSLWGGVLADRGDKRRLLLLTQSLLALTTMLLGVLVLAGVITYPQVLALALAMGIIAAIDTPIRQAFVVEMVGKDDLTNAVGINSTIFNAGRILGPAIAGVMIAVVGLGWAFVANAISSIAVLAGLWMMRPAELYPSPHLLRAKGQLRDGVRYVRHRQDLLLTMLLVFIIGTFGLNFQITTAILAKHVFHKSASGYGLLSTALAVGACIGAVLATRRRRRPGSLFLIGAALAFGLLEIASGLMPGFLSTALVLVPTGLAMLTFTTAANASVQLGVEPTMRGRVMALYLMCFMGGTPFGAPVVGWMASAIGPRWGIIGGGLISAGSAVVLGFALMRQRELSLGDAVAQLCARIIRRPLAETL